MLPSATQPLRYFEKEPTLSERCRRLESRPHLTGPNARPLRRSARCRRCFAAGFPGCRAAPSNSTGCCTRAKRCRHHPARPTPSAAGLWRRWARRSSVASPICTAKNQQLRWLHPQTRFGCITAVVDPCQDGQSLRLNDCLQPRQSLHHRVRAAARPSRTIEFSLLSRTPTRLVPETRSSRFDH
jgi:hypothetical protein